MSGPCPRPYVLVFLIVERRTVAKNCLHPLPLNFGVWNTSALVGHLRISASHYCEISAGDLTVNSCKRKNMFGQDL